IQPIIENSINYFDKKSEPIKIKLSCCLKDKILSLMIEDNGPGITNFTSKNSNAFSMNAIRKRVDIFNNKEIKDCLVISNINLTEFRNDGARTIIKIKIHENINH